ncbi:thiamine phosphate synthase [Campylobacter hepaticus]|uniref:Thiamine-phosphate synthase n=1 Tax=Campylobacter hepaticus TaxID=1813019 RepID=A0A424Z2A2_9BACT|nr:thiamine phosphate synthase [Campylobacter hepaticus]AXP08432.1 thiamine phosphate synthase [Campylobacter hepaticus]MCZ0772263.1 thiamine phosphate synthase [Campylobacter hepaticus]MCZ0773731.1 thiamine phosphate synthase [Campylobacter hepaticus]MCZ0774982.1 thiamine phosphate synthase [Campylobacter hepaticus]MDX2322850.1 thiamine phosphate synthase [Campylobacter hepaticus]
MRDKLDLSLYLVATRGTKSDELFLNILENAIKGGVSVIQLREKELNTRNFYELGLKVKKLCKNYGIPFLINDRLDIALALDADGVHLGQEDLELNLARKLLGEKKIIGLSLKTLEQLAFIKGADYLGCGAIKTTLTKKSSLLNLKILKQICQKSPIGVVAIGGIDKKIVKELQDINLKGIAVCRAIMEAKDAFLAAQELRCEINENLSFK